MPLIKRYPNRKLYDTEAKRYITLDQIAELVRTGKDVQVVDHESGDDLTNLTLTQIILDQEKKRDEGFLPRSLLTSLIRTGGGAIEGVRRSVQSGLEVANSVNPLRGELARIESVIEALLQQGKITAEQAQSLLSPRSSTSSTGPNAGANAGAGASADAQGGMNELLHRLNVPTQDDLAELQQQLAALNSRLDALLVEHGASGDEPLNRTD